MNRHQWWLVLVAAGAVVVILWARLPKEPRCQGVPVSVWAGELDNARTGHRERAVQAVLALGTNALPTLVGMLQAKDSPLKIWLRRWVERQHRFKFQFEDAERRRTKARLAIATLGARARPALPALIDLFESEPINPNTEWNDIASAVADVGPDAVPPLSAALTKGGERTRCHAVEALALLGPRAEPAVPALLKSLKDPSEHVRWRVCAALVKIREPSKAIVAGLIEALNDPSANVQQASLAALQELGPSAGPAIPAVRALSKTAPDPRVRYAADQAMSRLGSPGP